MKKFSENRAVPPDVRHLTEELDRWEDEYARHREAYLAAVYADPRPPDADIEAIAVLATVAIRQARLIRAKLHPGT